MCGARSLRHDKLQCHMFWEGDSLLHIGWADCVKVARVRPAAASSGAQTDSKRSLQIVASFQMDYLIAVRSQPGGNQCSALLLLLSVSKTDRCEWGWVVHQGIAPFGEDICLLACALAKEAFTTESEGTGAAEESNGAVPEEAPRPEVDNLNFCRAIS